ncbi:MAG: TonB-dependent receptor, partial [Bacteroidota bacterium]
MKTKMFFPFIFFSFLSSFIFAQNYQLKGKVVDEQDNEPLIGVNLVIEQLKVGASTNANGEFEFKNIPEGVYSLKTSFIGHKTIVKTISVPIKDDLIITLEEGSVNLQEVVVTGNPLFSDLKNISQSTLTIANLELQIKRSSNIAQILNYQPGISMRSNGTATARPVIRGFSDNRILILENGLRMGDLSNTSDDHGVSSDGSAPEKIEILRGPASLLYGSNAIGGVINIITEAIPNFIPDGIHGDINFNGGSANKNLSGSGDIHFGIDKFAFHSNYFNRSSKDYRDGNGSIVSNSDQLSQGFQLGMSFIPSFGIAGISFTNFNNNYGIPINPKEIDAEPVAINMKKNEFRFLAESSELNTFIKSFNLKAGYQDYAQKEIVRRTGESGTSFGLKSFSADLSFKHETIGSMFQGVFGFWGLKQRYTVEGLEALTPSADYFSFAAYFFEQTKFSNFNFQFGARVEQNQVKIPASIISGKAFPAEDKNYSTFSGSVGLVYNITEELSLFSNVANAFRSPTIEELSSYAIHEALVSFDIGNRSLQKENNLGLDLGFRIHKPNHLIEITAYYNSINNFIYAKPTSLFYNPNSAENPFNDSTGLRVRQYSQNDALIYGMEAKAQYEFNRFLLSTVVFDYVR